MSLPKRRPGSGGWKEARKPLRPSSREVRKAIGTSNFMIRVPLSSLSSGNFGEFEALAGARQSGSFSVWCRRIGEFDVTFDNRPTRSRWALILLGAAMLTLAGCGRKAGLDLPPDAPQLSSGEPVQGEASKPSVFNPS